MAAFLLRRAFPSPLARSARSSSSSSYVLFGYRFLPFSTGSSSKSPAVSYHNALEKLDKELVSASSELPVAPSGYPFSLAVSGNVAFLSRSYGTKEMVVVKIDGDDPSILMDVDIRTGFVTVSAKMTAKPDQLGISEVNVRDQDGNMGSYGDYLRTRGITPETISFLYQLLGFHQKRT